MFQVLSVDPAGRVLFSHRWQEVSRSLREGPLVPTTELDVAAETTRLLHLAIIAQLQCWEAVSNLETFLEGEYVCGSDEHRACRLYLSDVVSEMACASYKSIPEILTDASADRLRDMLREVQGS
jgi:hypothetical protein